ncbi:F-box domain-containing protein [Mycena venus]|uniref:F-box domain-containing protein n=1 Tax=Mycena venus TaxID=2733690 RepID=A0A8H6X3R9_9AGAR|nr:F-box domain-containing protein [Mycena venus]
MSVEELQARIDKLAADIDLQREVLKQLESSKSAAQGQLNAIRDPMARLPLEISSMIFLRCLPRSHPKPTARTAPMLLLNVCHAWTDIALSIPVLWTAIHIDFQGVELLRTWLQRARNYALSVSLRRCLDSRVVSVLRQFARQLKHLKIYDEELNDLDLAGAQSFSFLKTLTFGALLDAEEDLNSFDLDHIMGLMRLTPNLAECTFHNVHVDSSEDNDEDNKELIVLPRLLCLKFGRTTDVGNLAGEDSILRHLVLPAVKTLALPFSGISSTDFLFFLKRSLPPLQKLVLGDGCIQLHFSQLAESLLLVLSLVHLELGVGRNAVLVDHLLSELAASPHFLPNLHTLKVLFNSPPIFDALCQMVFHVLSARCPQLACIDIRAAHSIYFGVDAEVRDGLRKFAAQGIDIYIGDHTHNFISL